MPPDDLRERPSPAQARRRCRNGDDGVGSQPKQLRRKALSRSRQARYRLKQNQHEIDLSVSVTALKSEIEALHATRHELRFRRWRDRVSTSPARTAEQALTETAWAYLHCFRHGFRPRARGLWIPSSASRTAADSADATGSAQIQFVETHFQANVAHGGLRGRNALLEQWRRYSTCFASFEVRPSSLTLLHRADHSVCQVRSQMTMRITPATIERLVPHVQSLPSIAARLLDKTLTLDASVELGCVEKSKIDVCETHVSFADGFRALLDEYATVAFVLDGAFISAAGQLGRDLFERALCLRLQPPRVESNCADPPTIGAAPSPQHSPVAVDEMAPSSAPSDLRLDLAYILAPLS
ncbi:unnamed protein product [Globisporangium polare]